MGKYGGFAKQHLEPEVPSYFPCDSCGIPVSSRRSERVEGGYCSRCINQGPVRSRRQARLDKFNRKVVRK